MARRIFKLAVLMLLFTFIFCGCATTENCGGGIIANIGHDCGHFIGLPFGKAKEGADAIGGLAAALSGPEAKRDFDNYKTRREVGL